MKTTKSILIISVTLALSACIGYSNANTTEPQTQGSYRLIAYQDCNPIIKHTMDAEQVAAYKALKAAELDISASELPIKDIEDKLALLSKEMEAINKEAIQEDDDRLVINKALLAKQEEKAKQIEAVIESHAANFDAIDDYAEKIEAAANRFDKALKPIIGDLKEVNINIIEPGETQSARCLASS
ncbi:hypothetical protein [Pseudoalteromonas sp. DY56-GL79]|uniref:hypothetical protein n=1 Tax=Pseudoalteromonas sp. DY56-GL79 TaxID=2967131 RepID=UPI00352B6FAC